MSRKRDPQLCLFPGCTHERRRGHVMCWPHWRHVPRGMQDDLKATWRRDGLVKMLEKIPEAKEAIERSLKRGSRIVPWNRRRQAEAEQEAGE